MPRKASRSQSKRRKSAKKKKRKRRYRTDKHTHAKRRHARTRAHRHKARMFQEAETMNYLLHQLLKSASAPEDKPYHYHPRDPSKDPEYKWSSERMQKFKQGFAAPDFTLLRPQGDAEPTHRGNFPDWQHPHAPAVPHGEFF